MAQTYAIVEIGGKQYKVVPGQRIEVDHLPVAEGEDVELSKVLFIADGEDIIVGTPTIEGAKVIATCLGEKKGEKIIVFKYKAKTRYRRKKGHRQLYSTLEIKQIVKPGDTAGVTKRKKEKVAAGGN